jgi:hypothetical protein
MTNPNDLAYPIGNDEGYPVYPGLTKREFFAAMAMQGYLASYAGLSSSPFVEHIASKATQFADALIEELNKKP